MESVGGTKTESVTSRGVNCQGAFIARIAHSRIIGNAISHGRHDIIVIRHNDICPWRKMTHYGVLIGEASHQIGISLVFAKEILAGAVVGNFLVHGNNGIKKNAEVWTGVKLGMGAHR